MLRILSAAALACALGACNASDLTSLTNAAVVVSPNLPSTADVGQVLAGAGVTPAGQAAVATEISRVQIAAAKLCSFRPLASGILNVAIAASSNIATVANSGVGQGVRGAATIICNGLTIAPTYTAMGRGQIVRAIVSVNGIDVPVYGVRLR